ncbi:NAD(P)-dependent oxidoreductase [Microbacterium sp. SORGH_AS_0862]|uniref:NAD(P)-dependent oxidoreductase n=1 Tax=Microbacterium sp. SORGH_AS_0862 TaxID=3041789 RepID=UPI002791965C|nr:NAD(P)H-binding protein [Microbacterium sp. SORGH_AS_0862]MDQ1205523.1 putative NADH-flavin reductase [Microbacterium sp. SORGH_AS_0862]
MKIVIIGATGNLGSSIAEEALARGHEVVCISRNPVDIRHTDFPEIESLYGDCADIESLRASVPEGTDVLVNAVMPDPENPGSFPSWARNVIEVAKEKSVGRLVAVGDSCVFEVESGVLLKDTTFLTPFYRTWYGVHAQSHLEYLAEEELDWIEIAPAAKIFPDKRRYIYRVAVDELCTKDIRDPDYARQSYIGLEDYGYACMDEIEHPRHHRVRICVAY